MHWSGDDIREANETSLKHLHRLISGCGAINQENGLVESNCRGRERVIAGIGIPRNCLFGRKIMIEAFN